MNKIQPITEAPSLEIFNVINELVDAVNSLRGYDDPFSSGGYGIRGVLFSGEELLKVFSGGAQNISRSYMTRIQRAVVNRVCDYLACCPGDVEIKWDLINILRMEAGRMAKITEKDAT